MAPEEPRPRPEAEAPAPGPARAADGTDLSLIRWMLALDHGGRLAVLQSGARSLAWLIDARPER